MHSWPHQREKPFPLLSSQVTNRDITTETPEHDYKRCSTITGGVLEIENKQLFPTEHLYRLRWGRVMGQLCADGTSGVLTLTLTLRTAQTLSTGPSPFLLPCVYVSPCLSRLSHLWGNLLLNACISNLDGASYMLLQMSITIQPNYSTKMFDWILYCTIMTRRGTAHGTCRWMEDKQSFRVASREEVCFHLFSIFHSNTAKHLLILLQTICHMSNEW